MFYQTFPTNEFRHVSRKRNTCNSSVVSAKLKGNLFLRDPPRYERCLCRPNVNRFLMQAFCSIFKQHISLEENQHFQIYKKKGYSVKSLFIFWRDSSTPLPYKGVSVSWLCSHSVFSSLSQFKMDSNTVASFVQKPQTIVRFISIVSASVAHNLIQGRKRSFIS